MNNEFKIFVIGASAGGHSAVIEVLKDIPTGVNAAFLVTIHSSFEQLAFQEYLQKKIQLKVVEIGEEGEDIEPGKVYLSKTEHHLYVWEQRVMHVMGPRENLFRPSIDVLFRSAAVSMANRVVGVLLTGRLSYGTAGLIAIKRCGGVAVIQNPETAEYSDMPKTALNNVEVDYLFDLDKMADGILEICQQPLPPEQMVAESLKKEAQISANIKSQIKLEESLGDQVPLSCASCGGPLWKMKGEGPARYRCHVGHSFSQEALLQSQNDKLEETLWVALRTFEEKKILLQKMSQEYKSKGMNTLSRSYQYKIEELTEHIAQLRGLMQMYD